MASEVDICNLALSHIGDEAIVQTINPPDDTMQAQHCARFYPIARDAALEMHAWGFATRQEELPLQETTANGYYRYALPADLVRAITLTGADDTPQNFKREGAALVATVENARLTYVYREENTETYPPLFVSVVSYILASFLAGVIVKGTTGMQVAKALRDIANGQLAHAVAKEANSNRTRVSHVAPWHAARGVSDVR